MATNLVKHAKEGDILLRTLAHGALGGIEMISIDLESRKFRLF
jgi:hypothetical protein